MGSKCQADFHGELDCEDSDFYKIAQDEEFRRCPDCSMYIFRFDGCEKVICPCGCHFCHVCGAKGYRCECGGAYDDDYEDDYDDEDNGDSQNNNGENDDSNQNNDDDGNNHNNHEEE